VAHDPPGRTRGAAIGLHRILRVWLDRPYHLSYPLVFAEAVDRGIRFIHGYPSAIAIFAAYLARTGLAPFAQIAGVFPTSERFSADQHDIVRQAFDRATLVPFYGLSEKVAFACALPNDADVFAFDPLYGYTERR
jgi:hypothetical protein